MGNSALAFMMGVTLGAVFIYSIAQLGYVNLSGTNPPHIINQDQTSAQNNCMSQLNAALAILKDKLPTGTQSAIINTSNFGVVSTNQSITAIRSWANIWYSDPLMPGYYCPYNPSYFCSDLKIAYNQSMNVEGIVVKIETPTVTTTFPLLCGNGNLLRNAMSFIEHGA